MALLVAQFCAVDGSRRSSRGRGVYLLIYNKIVCSKWRHHSPFIISMILSVIWNFVFKTICILCIYDLKTSRNVCLAMNQPRLLDDKKALFRI